MPDVEPGRSIVHVRQPAPEGDRFAPGAFDRAIGTEFTMTRLGDAIEGTGRLVGAEVAPDGSHVVLALDVPDVPAVRRG